MNLENVSVRNVRNVQYVQLKLCKLSYWSWTGTHL